MYEWSVKAVDPSATGKLVVEVMESVENISQYEIFLAIGSADIAKVEVSLKRVTSVFLESSGFSIRIRSNTRLQSSVTGILVFRVNLLYVKTVFKWLQSPEVPLKSSLCRRLYKTCSSHW